MNRPARPGARPRKAATPRLAEILRVDHAGEYAAVAIYKGQSKVFSRSAKTRKLGTQMKHMQEEEQEHLDAFDALLNEHNVRPTAMAPVWNVAAYGLGVVTALMGEKAAHACTEAVETVIEQHYGAQAQELKDSDPEMSAVFTQFREDEIAHRDFAVSEGAKDAPGYPVLSRVITAGCKAAIKISEKI
jgi:ubiquinone biosynthesis monooxygenase Coq7